MILLLIALFTNTFVHASDNFSFEEDNSLPIVYMNIVTDSGSAQDPKDKLGLANLTYRMLLRGTHAHDKNTFNEELDRLGSQLSVDVRTEGTVIRAAVLSENLEPFLKLVTEALTQPRFSAEETAKLKKEVEADILDNLSDDHYLVSYHFQRFFYGDHPYSHPTVGTLSGVKKISAIDLLDNYSKLLGGSNLALFGTGEAKKEVIEAWFTDLQEKLNALHPDAHAVPKVAAPVPEVGRRILLVNKAGITQSQVLIGGVGPTPDTAGFYAIQLANHSFGGTTFESRMMKELRVKRGWTYGAYSSFQFGRQPRHYSLYFFPKTADTKPAIDLALALFQDYVKGGITKEEFDFSKTSLVNNAPFNYDTAKKRVENATTEHLTLLPHGYFKDYAGNIESVKMDGVLPALQGFFNPANLTIVVVGDASKLKKSLLTLPGFQPIVVKDFRQE